MSELLNSDEQGKPKKNIAKFLESDATLLLRFPEYRDVDRWCVYILECIDGTLYTGISNNIIKRLRAHRNGTGAKYTRGRTPLTLEAMKVVKNNSEALKLEHKVKKQRKDKKIDFLMSCII